MWIVYEHRNVPKQIKSLPTDILKRYEKWKDIVSISGPPGLRLIKGFHDELLGGEWKGHRSSRPGKQFRVVYRIEREQILVRVVSITAHDYRKKYYERLQGFQKAD
jgi:mRNA-degrading endonuclease RelE of RelBE toxin-antitoxin system